MNNETVKPMPASSPTPATHSRVISSPATSKMPPTVSR